MINIVEQLPPVLFARNEHILSVQLTPPEATNYSATIGAIEDVVHGTILSFLKPELGIDIYLTFQDYAPEDSDDYLPTPETSGYPSIYAYVTGFLVPKLQGYKALNIYYTVGAIWTAGEEFNLVVTALSYGPDYNLDTSYTTLDVSVVYGEDPVNANYLEADVQLCFFQRPSEAVNRVFNFERVALLSAKADEAGKVDLYLKNALSALLQPVLYKCNNQPAAVENIFRNIADFNLSLREISSAGAVISKKNVLFTSILGALPEPYGYERSKDYFDRSEGQNTVRLLSNQPTDCRVSPLICLPYSFINYAERDRKSYCSVGYILYKIVSGEIVTEAHAAGDISDLEQPIISSSIQLAASSEVVAIAVFGYDSESPEPGIFDMSKALRLLVDRQLYEDENFFFFYNDLGGTDLAWLTGKLEIQVEGSFVDYKSQSGRLTVNQAQKEAVTQVFRISTGLKTRKELEWLAELVTSELVHWYTRDQYHRFHAANVFERHLVDHQVIKIRPASIRYLPAVENMAAFDFEFELSYQSAALKKVL